jgi:hypothetical protein
VIAVVKVFESLPSNLPENPRSEQRVLIFFDCILDIGTLNPIGPLKGGIVTKWLVCQGGGDGASFIAFTPLQV